MPEPTCRVTTGPLDPAALLARVPEPSDGAVLLFLGIVRDENEGRAVDHLEYEAYRPMAERVMEAIVAEARVRWQTGTMAVEHRIGRLEIGEASVAIAVASPHRGSAYAASRYIIDELKKRVPIWKREGYRTGDMEWTAGVPPTAGPGSESPHLAEPAASAPAPRPPHSTPASS